MSESTAGQARRRERVESLIGLMAPILDLVLSVGDRVARIVEPADYETPPRPSGSRPGSPGRGGA